MYVDIGDSIALQYGGSEAHKKVSAERSESNIAGPIGKVRHPHLTHSFSTPFRADLILSFPFAAQRIAHVNPAVLQQRLYRSSETRRNVSEPRRLPSPSRFRPHPLLFCCCFSQESLFGILLAILSYYSLVGNGVRLLPAQLSRQGGERNIVLHEDLRASVRDRVEQRRGRRLCSFWSEAHAAVNFEERNLS